MIVLRGNYFIEFQKVENIHGKMFTAFSAEDFSFFTPSIALSLNGKR